MALPSTKASGKTPQHSYSAHYAEIALPLGVDKTFTYLIPPDLQSAAFIGVRAVVPFGRKYATGLIVGLSDSTSLASVKPVKDIIDASPVVSGELLRLCIWIAEYYFAPLGEVLKAAIPYGFSSSGKRLVRSNPLVDPASISELGQRAPKRAALLSLVSATRAMTAAELQKKVKIRNFHAVLNEMVKAGLIQTEELLPRPRHSPKIIEMVILSDVDPVRVELELKEISSRKKKAKALLSSLLSMKNAGLDEIAVQNLLKTSGTTSATLKALRQSGLIPTVRREVTRQQEYGTEEQTLNIVLNPEQREVLARITDAMEEENAKTILLHGVTGSGKTQVYIEGIRYCLNKGKTAIVLVPEISLTPQIVRRFKSHFSDQVAVVHSRMSAGERYDVWRLALRGDVRVVIGPRSAIFSPLANLGLIVVDEEHEASYKQFDATPRYNARDAAIVRGKNSNAVVVLGSATPSVESYHNTATGKYDLLHMSRRVDNVPMPDIAIVDMTGERKKEYAAMKDSLPQEQRMKLREFEQSSLSTLLKQKIEDRLSRREGIILLQNRRGFAPFVECMECGHPESCENCSVTLTYHLTKKHLRCHYCGSVTKPPSQCPQCGSAHIQLRGLGTQKVEQELSTLFPEAGILRMDLDTTSRKGAHDRILRKFGNAEADILLGTQMVAKGLDFAHVTLVGVISADTQMLLPDFRASERTFQLLTQVAGRAGRSRLHGEVVIQTHQPAHYTLQHVVDHDFNAFHQQELAARRELDYPPFSRLALIEAKGESEEAVREHAERFARLLKGANGAFTVLGPSPAVIAKINKNYRWHIILKNRKTHDPGGAHLRHALRKALRTFEPSRRRSVRLIVDIDPIGLM